MRIGLTSIHVDDQRAALAFTRPPTDVGPAGVPVFDDTCGHLVQIVSDAPGGSDA